MLCRKLPVLFVSHGAGPMPLLEVTDPVFRTVDKSSPSAAFMRSVSSYITSEVRNILVVSAHWEESQFTVSNQQRSSLLYDYGGFPKEAYAPYMTYDPPTDPALSTRVQELLSSANIPCRKQDRGLDHGAFIPLKAIYPEAKIPVIQLSLKSNLNPAEHIQLGEVLEPLRSEGTLIVCSGQITHNLSDLRRGAPTTSVDPRTSQFIEWIRSTLENTTPSTYAATKANYINIRSNAPHFDHAHPRTEHFVPLFVALGATYGRTAGTGDEKGIKRLYSEVTLGSMAIDSYIFN